LLSLLLLPLPPLAQPLVILMVLLLLPLPPLPLL
jgi:hypothetical protein